jgi:CTP synthase
MIRAIRYARERNLPFFGLCLGLQVATIEFARHMCGLPEANSTEFRPDGPEPVIDLMEEQHRIAGLGGTMRLGAYPCALTSGSLAHRLYGKEEISERHRHRWELNNRYRGILESKGLVISGNYKEKNLAEIVEYPDHPWFLAVQFHPEFKSKPTRPHPLFKGFMRAALAQKSVGLAVAAPSPRPREEAK